jgi:hypothetical protein
MKKGYKRHDGFTEWQECDTCHVRLGAGIHTEYDDTYYSPFYDSERCPVPGCGGTMGLPEFIPETHDALLASLEALKAFTSDKDAETLAEAIGVIRKFEQTVYILANAARYDGDPSIDEVINRILDIVVNHH